MLRAIKKAAGQGIPVKVNTVMGDFGKGGWRGLAELARRLMVDVRFIELMPVGHGKRFAATDPERLLEEIRLEFPEMRRDEKVHGYGPAVYYRIPGFLGGIGVIRAMHGKFCGECNRVRLTAQGFLKGCLCYEDGVDLRPILRDGAEMPKKDGYFRWEEKKDRTEIGERLKKAMEKGIWEKPEAHCFERPEDMTERRGMSAIGG